MESHQIYYLRDRKSKRLIDNDLGPENHPDYREKSQAAPKINRSYHSNRGNVEGIDISSSRKPWYGANAMVVTQVFLSAAVIALAANELFERNTSSSHVNRETPDQSDIKNENSPSTPNISSPEMPQVSPQFSPPQISGTEFSRVIHLQADDVSKSAIDNQGLQRPHLQSSQQRQYKGDHFVQVEFADIPITIADSSYSESPNLALPSGRVGREPGTSLIRLLEHLLNVAQEKREEGYREPIVITITLHEVEPGPNQPIMNDEGFDQIARLTKALEQEGTVISIIGPSWTLREQLRPYLSGSLQELCSASDLDECVDRALRKGRLMELSH